jgi:hypothetical protein
VAEPTVTLLALLDCDGAGGQVFLDCDTDGFDERPAAIDFRSSDVKGMLCHGERQIDLRFAALDEEADGRTRSGNPFINKRRHSNEENSRASPESARRQTHPRAEQLEPCAPLVPNAHRCPSSPFNDEQPRCRDSHVICAPLSSARFEYV